MSDSSIVQDMRRRADAADAKAAQYRRAGRDNEADAAARDAMRWRQVAAGSPRIWAEADQLVALAAHSNGEAR
jgi:hypothetical protein